MTNYTIQKNTTILTQYAAVFQKKSEVVKNIVQNIIFIILKISELGRTSCY